MKKTRKGYTLIELLIVITIISTLSAAISWAGRDATALAQAKAKAILANTRACRVAAMRFYAEHCDDASVNVSGTDTPMAETTAAAFLGNTDEGYNYVSNFSDFSDFSDGTVAITVNTSNATNKANNHVVVANGGQGLNNWSINVDLIFDTDQDNVITALSKTKGYGSLKPGEHNYFTVNLTTGEIAPGMGIGAIAPPPMIEEEGDW